MAAIFDTEDLCVQYGGDVALRNVTVSLERGSVAGIVGESGSGKSTLIRAALGALGQNGYISGGSVRLDGQEVTGMAQPARRSYLSSLAAFVPQDPQHAFSPVRTVGSQFVETARLRGGITRDQARLRAANLLDRMGLSDPERVLGSYVFELSGGMAQRAAIALALINSPKVIFADEPTSALDAATQVQVADELIMANQEFGASLLVVSHNIALTAHMAGYLYVMEGGKVVEEGPSRQVMTSPQHPCTRSLIASIPRLGVAR